MTKLISEIIRKMKIEMKFKNESEYYEINQH